MRQIAILLVVLFVIAYPSSSLLAAPPIGAPVGNILETDIVAQLWGREIPSYNVDSNTAIVAEDLQNYGFAVLWQEQRRELVLLYSPSGAINPLPPRNKSRVQVGRKVGDVLYTDIRVTLDGKNIKSFNMNGRTLILFEDLQRVAPVIWDEDNRIIGLGYTKVLYDSNKVGRVRGVITWQWNQFIGTKPDVGARIALMPTNASKSDDNQVFGFTLSQTPNGKNGFFSTVADGYGQYSLDDIPAGNYYLLVVSKNTTSNMQINEYDANRLKAIFDSDTWRSIEYNLKMNKYYLKEIQVKENRTVTESHDFGYTYY